MVLAVDAFAIIVGGFVGAMLVILLLLGLFHPRSGADALHWRPTRSPEAEAENELDDLDQMLAAANERRRARGESERTLADVERSVVAHQEEQQRRRQALSAEQGEADQEIAELLALKNERRARRGLPPLTREEYEASLRADA